MLGRRYGFNCPHCGAKMATTMTRYLDVKLQERYLKCANPSCQAVYKAFVEIKDVVSLPIDQTEKTV